MTNDAMPSFEEIWQEDNIQATIDTMVDIVCKAKYLKQDFKDDVIKTLIDDSDDNTSKELWQ